MDKYIITKISGMRAANKAQEFLFSRLAGMLHQTVTDTEDIENLRVSFEQTLKEAHKLAPKCLPMTVQLATNWNKPHGFDFNFSVTKKDSSGWIATVELSRIEKNWNS